MKRLLTYGLLLLTILASHFVVSACQDDSDKTTIMMTFTTRVENAPLGTTTDESAEVPQEQMKELRIIMARKDGTVIHNEKQSVTGNEHTFSFDVPMMAYTENFQFVAIANESALVSTTGTSIDLSNVDKAAFNNLKTLVIGQDGFFFGDDSQCIPQTIYWAQDITYGTETNIRKELQFVVGKITLEFKNETKETQSLTGIHIKGIIPNAQGNLFAQDNDFVGTQHDASAMQAADIIFNPVTDLGEGNSSGIQHYYTYPVGSYGVASSTLSFTQSEKTYEQPTLFATWNGIEYNLPITEVTDKGGNKHNFTSLARNERLKIVITLTPAGDITVNYEIAEWIDNPTNIGNPQPNPGGGYHVDPWGDVNDIIIGGGEAGENDWTLSDGTIIKGEQIQEDWTDFAGDQNDQLRVYIPNDKLVVGNRVVLDFRCAYDNCDRGQNFKIRFSTDQYSEQSIESTDSAEDDTYVYEVGTTHVRYLTLTESVIGKLHKPDWGAPNNQNDNYKVLILLTYDVNCEGAHKFGVTITKFGLITPRSATQ